MSYAEAQEKTAEAFIDGYNEFTVEGVLRVRADDCVHVMLPASLARPERTNAVYGKFFKGITTVMKDFKVRDEPFIYLNRESGRHTTDVS